MLFAHLIHLHTSLILEVISRLDIEPLNQLIGGVLVSAQGSSCQTSLIALYFSFLSNVEHA